MPRHQPTMFIPSWCCLILKSSHLELLRCLQFSNQHSAKMKRMCWLF
ncbi:Uncharacterized protein APZ42_006243 [Daphnia magna]|uniref:Uncharacterized protein n=1 Tax=Daphnia magna TaxID=35525 RepID=A0A164G0J3_9CRUS|nr:Uncharacterized protein APZ42_006243 [Daphnia magna]